MTANRSSFWTCFGPGLLWAAAAVGVSHLVQSTRAGGGFGFGFAFIIVITLILKFPFFEFGPRYAAATDESLVEGYRRIGRWALWLYLVITLATSVIVQSAIVLFTAFLLNYAFGWNLSLPLAGAVVLAACGLLLRLGQYRALDLSIKIIMALLAVSTLTAAAVALPRADFSSLALLPKVEWTLPQVGFLLALVGWMPSAVDISVWSSLWTLAKNRSRGERASLGNALLDFRIGYWGTAALAFCFLTLGASVMYTSGEEFSPLGTVFSTQLVDLYAKTLGEWARPVVLLAVLTTMFSTSLTVIDGFPRAIERSIQCLSTRSTQTLPNNAGRGYWITFVALAAATIVFLTRFIGNLTAMIDFATIVSFLTGPILGFLNLRAVTAPHVPAEARPSRLLITISWIGLLVLGGTGIAYIAWRLSG